MIQKHDLVVIRIDDPAQELPRFRIGEVQAVRDDAYDVFAEADGKLYKGIPARCVSNRSEHYMFLRAAAKDRMWQVPEVEAQMDLWPNGNRDINAADAMGNTVLHMPEVLNQPELVKFAILLGAKSTPNAAGLTPMDIARRCAPEMTVTLLAGMK